MHAYLTVQHSCTKPRKSNTEGNSNNKPFLTISLLCFNTISACISKGKKKQFSKLYLCNCQEKMGKIGFVLSVFRLFVFWTGKKSSRLPSLSAKVWWGNNTHIPRGGCRVDLLVYRECESQRKTCWTYTIRGACHCHSCWQAAKHSDSKLLSDSYPEMASLILQRDYSTV